MINWDRWRFPVPSSPCGNIHHTGSRGVGWRRVPVAARCPGRGIWSAFPVRVTTAIARPHAPRHGPSTVVGQMWITTCSIPQGSYTGWRWRRVPVAARCPAANLERIPGASYDCHRAPPRGRAMAPRSSLDKCGSRRVRFPRAHTQAGGGAFQ